MARSPARSPGRRRWAGTRSTALVGAALLLTGCGSGGNEDEACGPTIHEALDPAFLVHVLGDEEGLEYTSDPPTSGPHQTAPPVNGAADEAITRPVQVGILERGDVLVQYDPALSSAEQAELERLAGDGVVVAPNPDLPAPVVATAWLYKQTCEEVDAEALQVFVDARVGKGPGE